MTEEEEVEVEEVEEEEGEGTLGTSTLIRRARPSASTTSRAAAPG